MVRWTLRTSYAVAFVTLAAPCVAASDYSGSYLCIDEFGGGIAYDESLKTWVSAKFRPEGRFVLKTTKLREEPLYQGSDQVTGVYSVTIGKFGESDIYPCGDVNGVAMWDSFLTCGSLLNEYRVNLENMRFTNAYQSGYVDGRDNTENTPSIMGGTCAKID